MPQEEQDEGSDQDLEDAIGTAEANAEAIDELGATVESIGEQVQSIQEAVGADESDDDLSPEAQALQKQVDDLKATVEKKDDRIEELERQRARDLAVQAGIDEDDLDEVVDMAAEDPIAFTQKVIQDATGGQSSDTDGRPPKGGSAGPTTEDFGSYEEKRDYLAEEHDVEPGDQEYQETFKEEFGEDPYAA